MLAGCAGPSLTGTTYSREEARQVHYVRYGIVESVTPVVIEGRTDGPVGTGAGAIVGGIAGSNVGGGSGRAVGAVLGAVAGGVLGSTIEESATRKQGQEIMLRLDNGETISLVQEVEDGQFFRPGERVRLLQSGGTTRVTY
ncbi:glycine zipper 2TM domain-containing protein [Marinobacterium nitratireducens]|nr:glycine zipper 2TM domain-containing protein [Marinobacterium nitratireducens]